MSSLEVHVEGESIIVQIHGIRMELSPTAATTLVDFLQVHIPLAEQYSQQIRAHHQVRADAGANAGSWRSAAGSGEASQRRAAPGSPGRRRK